jgi:hypothetical protein
MERSHIYNEFNKERERQIEKWGHASHPLVREDRLDTGISDTRIGRKYKVSLRHGIQTEEKYKELCDFRSKTGTLAWADILIEETAEVIYSETPENLREELIQLGAVVTAMIEDLDKKETLIESLEPQPKSIVNSYPSTFEEDDEELDDEEEWEEYHDN